MNKNIGILGGTFNPIHIGHMQCAKVVIEQYSLDELLIMPASIPNFKQNKKIASANDRLNMCKLAINESKLSNVKVSDIELKMDGVTYTSETMRVLKEIYPNDNLFFICGSDSAYSLMDWHNYREILKLCTIIAVVRKGTKLSDPKIINFFIDNNKRLKFLKADVMEVSSSKIRKMIIQGEPTDDYLFSSVKKYIIDNSLYNCKIS